LEQKEHSRIEKIATNKKLNTKMNNHSNQTTK